MEIKIRNLTKKFDDVTAINNLNIDISEGVTGLMGENGAGKSTLFRLISDVIYPNSGEILIDNEPAKTKFAKESIFFLPDDPYCPKDAKIAGAYDFYSCFYNIDKEGFYSLVKEFDLPLDKRVATFSKGMKRRLFIALSLSVSCPILLLDEVFDGIDPLALESIKEKIVKLGTEGKTIVIATHNLACLDRLANRFLLLYKGNLKADGNEDDLSSNLIKYQIAYPSSLDEAFFANLGFKVVSFRQIGSIYNVVVMENKEAYEKLKDKNPTLLEEVPLENDEVFASRMKLASMEGNEHE